MSLDTELAARFAKERRRTATILRGVQEKCRDRRLTANELFEVAARHIELGDEHGTLWGECMRCRSESGGPMLTEMPFGYAEWSCRECGQMVLPVESSR